MSRSAKYLLGTSVLLTALLFWLDRDDGGPQPLRQTLFEIVVFGGMYTLLFFLFFSGVYFISKKIFRTK